MTLPAASPLLPALPPSLPARILTPALPHGSPRAERMWLGRMFVPPGRFSAAAESLNLFVLGCTARGVPGMGKFRFPWVGGGVFFLSPPPPRWLFRAGVLRGEGRISRLIRRFLSTPGAAADQHRKPRELGSGGGEGWERWERPSGKRESAQVRAGATSTTFWVRRNARESLPFPSQHREIPLGNV